MDNLQGFNNEVTMTSLNVAELTGKRHDNVMSDIRNEIEQLKDAGIFNLLIFEEIEYKDSKGRTYKCYQFGMEGALQLGARYSAETRYKMIQYIKQLELEKIQNQFNLPRNYKEALGQLLEQVEVNEKLLPKAEYYDMVLSSESTFTVTDLAKELGMSAKSLNALLIKLGVQFKQGNSYYLMAKYQDKGYTETKTLVIVKSFNRTETIHQLRWTETGRKFIIDLLSSNQQFKKDLK
jgi:Rha family phage regulatory protein